MTTTTHPPASRRRASSTPGYFTRAQVEEDLGLTANERDTFERAGIIGATERRVRGDTRPVLYSATDLALARAAMAAHRLGVRGEALRHLVAAIQPKRGRLVPGWSGFAIVDAGLDVDLVPVGVDVGALIASRGTQPALLVLHLTVPSHIA